MKRFHAKLNKQSVIGSLVFVFDFALGAAS